MGWWFMSITSSLTWTWSFTGIYGGEKAMGITSQRQAVTLTCFTLRVLGLILIINSSLASSLITALHLLELEIASYRRSSHLICSGEQRIFNNSWWISEDSKTRTLEDKIGPSTTSIFYRLALVLVAQGTFPFHGTKLYRTDHHLCNTSRIWLGNNICQ